MRQLKSDIETCSSAQELGLVHITPIQPISPEMGHGAGGSSQFKAIKIENEESRDARSVDRHKELDEKDLDEVCEETSFQKSLNKKKKWAVKTLQGIFFVLYFIRIQM